MAKRFPKAAMQLAAGKGVNATPPTNGNQQKMYPKLSSKVPMQRPGDPNSFTKRGIRGNRDFGNAVGNAPKSADLRGWEQAHADGIAFDAQQGAAERKARKKLNKSGNALTR